MSGKRPYESPQSLIDKMERGNKCVTEVVMSEEKGELKLVIKDNKLTKQAIKKGGTTLKDFMKSDGSPGYFSLELNVYGREGKPCPRCHTILKSTRIGTRNTVYCPKCQRKEE